MKKKIYKLFLVLIVSLSLYSGSIAQNKIARMLEALSRKNNVQVQELNEEKEYEETENGESVGTVGIWGMAVAVFLNLYGDIVDNVLKSRSKDKNAT